MLYVEGAKNRCKIWKPHPTPPHPIYKYIQIYAYIYVSPKKFTSIFGAVMLYVEGAKNRCKIWKPHPTPYLFIYRPRGRAPARPRREFFLRRGELFQQSILCMI